MTPATLIPLPKAAQAPGMARRAIDTVAPLRPDVAVNVRLLVSELITNAVRHVPERGALGMSVELEDGALRVEVVDPGSGFRPRPRDGHSPLGGSWGLHLVDQLADRWGVESGRPTRVWFEIDDASPG